jgi:hypothetical protein
MNPARTATASKAADLIKSPPGLRDECVRRAHLALIEVEAADKDLQREFAHKMNPAKKVSARFQRGAQKPASCHEPSRPARRFADHL